MNSSASVVRVAITAVTVRARWRERCAQEDGRGCYQTGKQRNSSKCESTSEIILLLVYDLLSIEFREPSGILHEERKVSQQAAWLFLYFAPGLDPRKLT